MKLFSVTYKDNIYEFLCYDINIDRDNKEF